MIMMKVYYILIYRLCVLKIFNFFSNFLYFIRYIEVFVKKRQMQFKYAFNTTKRQNLFTKNYEEIMIFFALTHWQLIHSPGSM